MRIVLTCLPIHTERGKFDNAIGSAELLAHAIVRSVRNA